MPYDGHRNIWSGAKRKTGPWVPTSIKRLRPSSEVGSPYPVPRKLYTRTGGGFVERSRKQMGSAGGVALHKWGPSLLQHAAMHEYGLENLQYVSLLDSPLFTPGTSRAQQLRPIPAKPSMAERARWIATPGGRLVAAGDQLRCQMGDLFITESEALPLLQRGASVLSELKPIRMRSHVSSVARVDPHIPFSSKDLHRLHQFC